MSALRPDYDDDPGRSRSFQAGWQEDIHSPVAARLVSEGVDSVVDVGCGIGRFATAVAGRLRWVGVDASSRQLADCPHRPIASADAVNLPFRTGSIRALVMLYMLYHLEEPARALREAKRVLRPGGLLAVCTMSRANDPELVPNGYPPTSFDAEEAADIVAGVFGPEKIDIERWDHPLVRLQDRAEVIAYARSHLLPASVADAVSLPMTLTKRGCLIWARR